MPQDKYIAFKETQNILDPVGPYASILQAAATAEMDARVLEVDKIAESYKAEQQEQQLQQQQQLEQQDTAILEGDSTGKITPISAQEKESAKTVSNSESFNQALAGENNNTPLAETNDVTILDTFAKKKTHLMSKGYSDELATSILNPRVDALIETTSPIEFLATGSVASAKMAGMAGLKLFIAAAPIEFMGTVAAEEIAEDNMLVGIAGEVLFGIGTGALANVLAKSVRKAATKSALKIRVKVLKDAPEAPVSNVAANKIKVKTRKLQKYVEIGDLRKTEVREVFKEAIVEAKTQRLKPAEAALVKGLEQKIQIASAQSAKYLEQPDAPSFESSTIAKPKISARARAAVEAQVKAEWYGLKTPIVEKDIANRVKAILARDKSASYTHVENSIREGIEKEYLNGKLFKEDLAADVDQILTAAKKAGKKLTPENKLKVWGDAQKKLTQEYREGVAEEIEEKLKDLSPSSFPGKRVGVKGGMGSDDARFLVPPGQIHNVDGTLKVKDWEITDHLEFNPDTNNLHFKSSDALQVIPGGLPSIEKSNLFNYDKLSTRGLQIHEIKAFINTWDPGINKKLLVWRKAKFRGKPQNTANLKEADQFKKPTEIYDSVEKSFIKIQALPETEIEAIAKLYGWNNALVQDTPKTFQKITGEESKSLSFQNLADDVIIGKNMAEEWEVTNPDWLKGQAKAIKRNKKINAGELKGELTDIHPRYWKMTGGRSAYRNQREVFLREKLGLSKKGPGEPNWPYYQKLDHLAVVRNKMIEDITHLQGSVDQAKAKEMYILLGDVLSGSDRVGVMSRMSRANMREGAWEELTRVKQGEAAAEDIEANIVARADREGITVEEATEQHLMDTFNTRRAQDETDEALQRWGAESGEVSEIPEAAKLSDEAGTSMHIVGSRFDELASPNRLATSEQLAKLEDHFGVRVIEDRYVPGTLHTPGTINIFKINTVADIEKMVEVFDRPSSLPGFSGSIGDLVFGSINAKQVLGIEVNSSHAPEIADRLTHIAHDSQQQMSVLASKLTESPDDVATAIAFQKLKAINAIVSTQLTEGIPSTQSLLALQHLALDATSDQELLEKMAGVVKSNHAVYNLEDVDISDTVELAARLVSLSNSSQKGYLLNSLAKNDEFLKLTASRLDLVAKRDAVIKTIREACDA